MTDTEEKKNVEGAPDTAPVSREKKARPGPKAEEALPPAAVTNAAPATGIPTMRSRKETPAPVAALVSATGTSRIVAEALKTAYRWTERTRLTRSEFLRKRSEWLNRSAREV
jgi:hypothetical protein